MIGSSGAKSPRIGGMHIPMRDEYGVENSRQSYHLRENREMEQRRPQQLETKRQLSHNHQEPQRLLSMARKVVNALGESEQEQRTDRQRVTLDPKQLSYRNQIQELIKQNEELKLRQRQAEIRAEQLQGIMSGSREATPHKRRLFMPNASEIQSEGEVNCNLIGKYQLSVRRMLELYGLTREQSSIEGCASERDIIEFLLRTMCHKHDSIKSKEAEDRARLAHDQREIAKVRESLRMLTQTSELFKNRENKYKEKADEMRREWLNTSSKLAKSENMRQELELEAATTEKAFYELQKQMIRAQEEYRADQQEKSRIIKELEQQIIEFSNEANRSKARCQQLEMDISEARLQSEEWQLKLKVKQDDLARSVREAARWRQRFEWIEQEKSNSSAGEYTKSIAMSRKRFEQPIQPEYRSKELQHIQERSSEILDDAIEDETILQSVPYRPKRSQQHPKDVKFRQPSSTEPPIFTRKEVTLTQGSNSEQGGPEVTKYPIRRIMTIGEPDPPSNTSSHSATNLIENMLNRLEHYADKLGPHSHS